MLSSLGQCNHGTDFYFAMYQRQVWPWWYGHLYITTLSPNNVTYHIENSTAIISSGNVSNDSPATVYSDGGNVNNDSLGPIRSDDLWPWSSSSMHVYTNGGLISVLVYHINWWWCCHDNINVYQFQPYQDLAIPTQYIYYTVSTNGTYGFTMSYFSITGNEDNTVVTISPTETITIPQDLQGPNSTNITIPAGGVHTVTINRLQRLQVGVDDFGDITGTSIVSDKPLTVISGHECAHVPDDYYEYYCSHVAVQIPPTVTWGQTFLLTPYQLRPSQYYKVMAAYSSTTVTYTCTDGNGGNIVLESAGDSDTVVVENKGNWWNMENSVYCYIESSKPILVVQLGPGSHFQIGSLRHHDGNVVMSNIPSVKQYSKNISFYHPGDDYWYIEYHYINIATTVQDTTVTMDDEVLSLSWTTIYDTNNLSVGYGATVKFNNIYNNYSTLHSTSPISVLVYSWDSHVGYSYSAGVELQKKYNISDEGA